MATATAEKKDTLHPIAKFQEQINSRANELKHALPPHMPVERFIRVILTSVQLNPDLLTVDRTSLWNACMRAAQDGLLPDGREGVILPYNTKGKDGSYKLLAQWQPMIGGLLKRFRNSGQFKSISADIVREGEEFSYFKDEKGEHLRHVPGDEGGKMIKAYAVAMTNDGGVMIKVMSAKDIEKRRDVSKAKEGPAWKQWPEEMAMKTVLRNLAKRLPSSADLDDLMRRDEELYADRLTDRTNLVPISGSAAALEHFGEHDDPKPEAEKETDTSDTGADDTGTDDAGDESDPIKQAFARGSRDKQQGMQRRAVPTEYRTPEAASLAKAWVSGWDAG